MPWKNFIADWSTMLSFQKRLWIPALLAFLAPMPFAGQQKETKCSDFLYGLYYGSWEEPENNDLAFVISPDGKPIPPKANDSEAPTKPGFYVLQKRFEFASSKFSPQGFSFQTKAVDGTAYSFQGKFACEMVGGIDGEVPYLEGELKETRNSKVVRRKKLHFGHAIVL